MKRVLSILTLFLAIGLPVLAQSQNCKKWSEGMLSWDDFNGSAVMKTTPSHFAANLNTVSEEDIKGGKKMLYRITAEALMSRDESYADSTMRTAQKLRYYQLMFDQLELYRRRLQNDLNTGMSGIEADKRLAHYRNLYKDQVKAIEKETEIDFARAQKAKERAEKRINSKDENIDIKRVEIALQRAINRLTLK